MLEMVYVAALIAGGGLVLVSSLAGGTDGDFEVEGDADSPGVASSLAPFLQLKFWSFFAAFFGLTGFLLERQGVAGWLSLLLSLLVGLLCGFTISWSLDKLKSSQHGSQLSTGRLVGREGEVRTAIRGETPGEIRLIHGERGVDFLAVSDVPERIEAGTIVVVVSVEDTRLRVLPKQLLIDGESSL